MHFSTGTLGWTYYWLPHSYKHSHDQIFPLSCSMAEQMPGEKPAVRIPDVMQRLIHERQFLSIKFHEKQVDSNHMIKT